MNIDIQLADRYAVIRLSGDFESYAVGGFLAAVKQVQDQGVSLVVLNQRKVKFINSTAIGAVLRARKELKAAGGGLAVARSSAFVREVFEKLGLESVVPFFDEEEDAIEALLELVPAEQSEAVAAEGDAALLFRFYAQEQADLLGRRGVAAGEISVIEVEGLTFCWDPGKRRLDPAGAAKLFAAGSELELKFRLPLFSRSTYYVTDATILGAQADGAQFKVRVRFSGLDDDAARAVRQYVADMSLVRDEVDKARRSR
ncbi:MAG: STAS domain-containing protein [Planctomycetes bacterium]|nr:STAS domain-containing protein [Planctomycetota bacterium]MBL7007968.1 STAS domain-containing protein [Planctomycetota bacterium]